MTCSAVIFDWSLADLPDWLITATWQGALLAGAVLLITAVLGRWLTPAWRHTLWLLVVLRFAVPVLPASPTSVFNLTADAATSPSPTATVTFRPGGDAALPLTDRIAAAPATMTPPRRVPLLVMIWLAGVVVSLGWVMWLNVRLARLCRRCTPIDDEAVRRLVDDCGARLRVRRRVRLCRADFLDGPGVVGVFRPTLLLPGRVLDTLSDDELRHVLMHELAHVRRHDVVLHWLVTLVRAVHWFNPLVWLAASRLAHERELACDALALARTDTSLHHDYGRAIVKVLEQFAHRHPGPAIAAASGAAPTPSHLRSRIMHVRRFRRPSPVASLIGLTVAAVFTATLLTAAQPPASAPSRVESRPVAAPDTEAAPTPSGGASIAQMSPTIQLHETDDGHRVIVVIDGVRRIELRPRSGEGRHGSADRGVVGQPDAWIAKAEVYNTAKADGAGKVEMTCQLTVAGTSGMRQWRGVAKMEPGRTYPLTEFRAAAEAAPRLIPSITRSVRVSPALEAPDAVKGEEPPEPEAAAAERAEVTVDARFLLLDPAVFDAQVAPLLAAGKPTTLSEDAVVALLRKLAEADAPHTLTAPRVKVIEGQPAWVQIAEQVAFVRDYEMKKTDTGTAYVPLIDTLSLGTLLEITTEVRGDGDVRLRAGTTLTSRTGPTTRERFAGATDRDDLFVERPRYGSVSADADVVVKPDGWALMSCGIVTGRMPHEGDDVEFTAKRRAVVLLRPSVGEVK